MQASQMPSQKPNSYEIIIGPKVDVTQDKKSRSRVISFPFEYPDGEKGALIILRLQDEDWKPHESITKITIHFT